MVPVIGSRFTGTLTAAVRSCGAPLWTEDTEEMSAVDDEGRHHRLYRHLG